MKTNMTKFLGSIFAPSVVSDILDNQEPTGLGKDCATGLKNAVVAQIGIKAWDKLLKRLISWLDGFYMAFRRGLNGD